MARTNATNFTGGLQFPYATAAADLFKKEDVQVLAQAVDQHDHTTGKGVAVNTTPANASITNAMLASDVARANLLTNGGFEIWQRGNGAFTANGAYSADRWYPEAGTLSVSRDTTNMDNGSGACAAVISSGSGGAFSQQVGAGSDGLRLGLGGRTVSWSVRVRTSTANAVRLRLDGNVTGTPSAYHSGNGAYQTLTVTETVPVGVTALSARVLLDATCTAYIDNAMLVVGSQPADYAPLHPADDLARCLRYYEMLGGDTGLYLFVSGYQPGPGGINYTPYGYKAHKAVSPTVTKNGTWTVSNAGQPAVQGFNQDGLVLNIGTVAAGAGYAFANAVGQNVTVESNP